MPAWLLALAMVSLAAPVSEPEIPSEPVPLEPTADPEPHAPPQVPEHVAAPAMVVHIDRTPSATPARRTAVPAEPEPSKLPQRDAKARLDAPDPREYRAVRRVDPIVLDGRITERTWLRAPIDDRFAERQPELGGVPPIRTTMRIAYDDDFLYVLVECESKPGDVIVRTLRRDNGGIYDDDTVSIKIDASHEHRDAVSLGVNAEGAQIDTLGLQDGRLWISEWDGVWDAATVRRNDGYTVEYRVPFAILGVRGGEDVTIGFDLSRDHPSRNATYDWRLFVPPRSPLAASQFGHVTGLRGIKGKRAIEYTPYALARTNFSRTFTVDPRRRPNLAAGADLRVMTHPASYVEASLLTDFAQVEADEVQVARDRFPLFFPERRPFFINGLDVFNFGRPGEAQIFFSRRVGLVSGQPVPLLGGAKVYGRAGPVGYGVLNVQTLGSPDDPSRGLVAAVPENVSVGRVRVQIIKGVNLGVMGLGRHRFNAPHSDDAAGGVDAQLLALDGRLQYYGFVAGTWAQTPATQSAVDSAGTVQPSTTERSAIGASGYSQVEYNGLFVRPRAVWLWSDEDLDPRLGFYRRPGSSRQEASVSVVPRPRVLGLREIEFGPVVSVETDPDYEELLGRSSGGSLQIRWRNGAGIGADTRQFADVVTQPFELYGYTVEAERYVGLRHSVWAETPSRRAVVANAGYEVIDLFGGRAHQPTVGITARAGKHFTIAGQYTHLVGHLKDPGEDFNFGYANANMDIAITKNIAFDNLGRLDLSPYSQRVGVQSRFRWRFRPGSDLFVVYRNNLPFGAEDPTRATAREPFHEITVKVTVYMRAFVGR